MLANIIKKLKRIDNSTHNHYSDQNAELILKAREECAFCNKGDIVIVDLGLQQTPPIPGNRQEAYVLETTSNDIKLALILGQVITIWVPDWAITSNLGPKYWTKEQLEQVNVVTPVHNKLPLVTGTFIEEEENEYFLVEIDKVNGVYLIHDVDECEATIIKPDHERILHVFSKPEEGKYILEPGMYLDHKNILVEIIPFKGKCWYRRINETKIYELEESYATKLSRIEIDDVGLDYYIVEDGPTQEPTQKETATQEKTACECGTPQCNWFPPEKLAEIKELEDPKKYEIIDKELGIDKERGQDQTTSPG